MRAFVTVGSTRFDALVHKILDSETLVALSQRGYTDLVIQVGNSNLDSVGGPPPSDDAQFLDLNGVKVEYWRFKPSLEQEYARADLIISHAGAGTILDGLRRGKAMIVVPNPTLLHNHQQELADALAKQRYLASSNLRDLPVVIQELRPTSFNAFPPFDGSKFARILDETMGFEEEE